MSHSFLFSGIRRIVATFLMLSLISNAVGQMEDVSQKSSTATDDSLSAVTEDNESVDTGSAGRTDSALPKEEGASTKSTDYYRGDPIKNQSSMQNRGVSAGQKTTESIAQRKLLPPPVIVDTSNISGITSDSEQNKQYRMGRTEKRILIVTGAVLVSGGLALILAKSLGKDDKPGEGAGFPEPPRPPEY